MKASQILESGPDWFVVPVQQVYFSGDHLQLPAVTLQTQEQTVVKDEDLLAAGMRSTGESLFETLQAMSEERQWECDRNVDQTGEGMHGKSWNFHQQKFYKGSLQLVNQQVRWHSTIKQNYGCDWLAGGSLEPFTQAVPDYIYSSTSW